MPKGLKKLGTACVTLGVITTIVSIYSLKFALPLSIMGMILSGYYVFIDTKNQLNDSAITPGIIGMVLSSVPVLFILLVIVYHYFKHS